jgi:hypothetical protein
MKRRGSTNKYDTKLAWRIDKSSIHGIGVIANRLIKKGTHLNLPVPDTGSLFNGYNHSCNPTCKLTPSRIIVLRDIAKDEELTLFYIDCVGPVCFCPECDGRPIRRTKRGM